MVDGLAVWSAAAAYWYLFVAVQWRSVGARTELLGGESA